MNAHRRQPPSDAEAAAALAAWAGSPPMRVERIDGGAVNDTWRVTFVDRVAALRRHRRSFPASVALEHATATFARERGISSPLAIPTASGEPFLDMEDGCWTLYEWAEGEPLRRSLLESGGRVPLSSRDAALMGQWLGGLHNVLAGFPLRAPGEPYADALVWSDWMEKRSAKESTERISDLIKRIDEMSDRSAADEDACASLVDRCRWLEEHPDFAPPPPAEPRQLIHGDYNASNLFVCNGRLSSLIDWDEI